jgi:hypothetical protein
MDEPMDELYTAVQAAKALGVSYKQIHYALLRYGTQPYEPHAVRLVTLAEAKAALAQVRSSVRHARVEPEPVSESDTPRRKPGAWAATPGSDQTP